MPPNNPPVPTPDSPKGPARRWPHNLHQRGTWLVIALVAIGLGLVAYFGLRHQSATTRHPAAPAAVTITATGFSPQEITIAPGTQVSWTNNDSAAHEVAADPYPKNNSISGFNSSVLLQTGDSYNFSFAKAGTYHYHDQLNPFKLLGTVVVK